MLLRALCLAALLAPAISGAQSAPQSQSLPQVARIAKTVFIQKNARDQILIDAVHLALISSNLRWVDDRNQADIVFYFAALESPPGPPDDKFHWAFTLTVADRQDKSLWWIGSDDGAGRGDDAPTYIDEKEWLNLLNAHWAKKCVDQFLELRSK